MDTAAMLLDAPSKTSDESCNSNRTCTRRTGRNWDNAIHAHEEVLPELTQFAARLRATSQASAKQAAAFEYAAENGLRALAKDPVTRHPPHELSPTANRPGDPPNLGTVSTKQFAQWQRIAWAKRLHR